MGNVISSNDISKSRILRIEQGEKPKDVMSLWMKIKDWFQSHKRENALKLIENIILENKNDKGNAFNSVFDCLQLKTFLLNAYKENVNISTSNDNKNVTISIGGSDIFSKSIDDEESFKISKIINIFDNHQSIFTDKTALQCLYEKINQCSTNNKNIENDKILAELYIELHNKINKGEINLKLSNNNFYKVDYDSLSEELNSKIEEIKSDVDMKKILKKDINRGRYIVNGNEIKSKDQEEAMAEFESLISKFSDKNKKAIYSLAHQNGLTLLKSHSKNHDYYTLTTSFSANNISKQEKTYNIKAISGDCIELKIKFLKESTGRVNNIKLAKPEESVLFNFLYNVIVANNNLKYDDDKGLNEKIWDIKNELDKNVIPQGANFLDLWGKNKIIKDDRVDIILKLDGGKLVSLDGECSYNFY